MHHGSGLGGLSRNHVEGHGLQTGLGHVIEHVDVTVLLQLISEDLLQLRVQIFRKVLQMVLYCNLLLLFRKSVIAVWGMIERGLKRSWVRKIGDAVLRVKPH